MTKTIGMAMLLIGIAGNAFAGLAPSPELDASAGAGALTLLAGGLLVLRSRRRKA